MRSSSLVLAFFLLARGSLFAQEEVRFQSSDGHAVHGYMYSADAAGTPARAMIIAFNQGGGDARSEYASIAPRLAAAGFDVLAVDARSGGDRFGGENRTVSEWGGSQPFCSAQGDVEGALAYALAERPDQPVILWGSSFSAALVLRVAASSDDVDAVLSFSPASGGPMAACRGEDVSGAIAAPVLVLRPAAEAERAPAQLEEFRRQGHEVYIAEPGTHGSSMLVESRVEGGVEDTWARVLSFLDAAFPVSSASQALAVVSRGGDEVVVIDLGTGERLAALRVGNFPHEIAGRSGSLAFVPSYGGNQVSALDLVHQQHVATWDLSPLTALHGASLSSDGQLLWVTAEEERSVLEVATATGEIVRKWPTSGYRSHMVVATPNDEKLYVANIDDGTVSIVDRASGRVAVLATGAGAEGIDVAPDGGEVWVSNREDATIAVIDTDSDEVVRWFPSGGEFPVKLRFSPDGSRVAVANNRSSSIAVFDVAGRSLLASIDTGDRPLGLAFSGDSRFVYVSRPGANEVVEVDLESFRVTRRLPVGDGPDGIVWLPRGGP